MDEKTPPRSGPPPAEDGRYAWASAAGAQEPSSPDAVAGDDRAKVDASTSSRGGEDTFGAPRDGGGWRVFKNVAIALFTIVLVGFKYLKFAILPILKFMPVVLKTGGTMAVSVGFYAMAWGWKFAVGFVLLLFVHECGHLLVARRFGLPVSAPMFIPFMGAFIALKGQPRNAWVEAMVGIGGPALGAVGALACAMIGVYTGNDFWFALAYCGCLLNLFNLIPIGALDGGRIAMAVSPWLWVVGLVLILAMVIQRPNLVLIFVLVTAMPRLFSLFRTKTDAEREYLAIPASQRVAVAVMYFCLAGALAWGMDASHVAKP